MQSLDIIRDALLSVSGNVGHYRALKKHPPYFVWAEDGATALRSNNRTGDQAFTGSAHLFTAKENDPLVTQTQNAFNDAGVAWYLESIQYEEDTKYIHYAWVWSV